MNQAAGALTAFSRSIGYRGWTIAFVGFVSIACVFATSTAAFPLLYASVLDEFGWSSTQTTLLFTYKNAASAVVALFLIGPLCERVSLRVVTLGAFVLTGLAMVSFLWIGNLWTYYAAGVLLGVGVTASFVATKILVSRWFVVNQGLALGVVMAGSSVGGFVTPVLYQSLLEALGWRAAFASLSLCIWAVALPLYLAKVKEQPSTADLAQDLAPRSAGVPSTSPEGRAVPVLELLAQPSVGWAALSLFLVGSADAGMMQHTALFLQRETGLSTSATAMTLSAMLSLGVLAKAGAGWVYDRFSLMGIRSWYLLLAASILMTQALVGPLTLALFVALRGVAHSGLMAEPAVVVKHCYGPRFMNVGVPVFMGAWLAGAAVGPLVLSLSYDLRGTYRPGFMTLLAFSVIAVGALRRVRPAFWRQCVARATDRE